MPAVDPDLLREWNSLPREQRRWMRLLAAGRLALTNNAFIACYFLAKRGLAERVEHCTWVLTDRGRQVLDAYNACDAGAPLSGAEEGGTCGR